MRSDSICALRSALSVFEPVLDKSLVAQLTHPFLIRFVGFLRAQCLPCAQPLLLLRHVLVAAFENLDQMPAKWRTRRFADLPGFQSIHRLLEFRNRIPGRKPAQIAAAGSAAIFGLQSRELGEISVVIESLFQLDQTIFGI